MTFPDLVMQLDKHGARALWGVMLDVYPKDIATFVESTMSARIDMEATWYFDGEQHLRFRRNRAPKIIYPGARARLFCDYGMDKLYPMLGVRKHDRLSRLMRTAGFRRTPLPYNSIVKPVLLRWSDNCYFKNSHYTNLPGSKSHLLPIQHFRFSGSLTRKAEMALRENNYFLNSSDYRLLSDLIRTMTERNGSFLYRNSRPLESFEDLAETCNAVGF